MVAQKELYGSKTYKFGTLNNLYICTMTEFLMQNWGELLIGLMAFVKIIVNITPTTEDNKIFGWLDSLVNMIVSDRKKN